MRRLLEVVIALKLAAGMPPEPAGRMPSPRSARFNRRHKFFVHVFSGRHKSLLVDGSGNGDLKSVCDYVHLNPVRARLLEPEQRLTWLWIAERLAMGHWRTASNAARQHG